MTTVEGEGVHSGERARVTLHRDDGPILFRLGATVVPADVDSVVDTPRCTVLGADGARVATVEHLLAALAAAGFWGGVTIEVEGPELPILDGSAAGWEAAVAALGAPPPAPPPHVLDGPVEVVAGASRVRADPGGPALDVSIDFEHAAIGRQRWHGGPDRYRELLDARTFVDHDELVALQARGFARGAQRGRGIVFTAHGPEPALRSPDEPVRHKALDALGDLVLMGRPIAALVTIDRGSHAAHVAFMRHLRSRPPHAASGPARGPAS